jgi:hypothetical protein
MSQTFLAWTLDGGEWLALRPGRFTFRERTAITQWIGSWVELIASLDAVENRKISCPAWK